MSGPSEPLSLSRGAALITIATGISRLTGFVRVAAAAAAMGTTFLANTYQSANTAPNLVFELLAAGVLTSVFVPTFVEHIVGGRREEGWDAANALTSVALVGLIGIAAVVALAAPWIMQIFLVGVEDPATRAEAVDLGARFLRLFAPQVIFYGAGMIMTAALHAHRRFLLAAAAPIFNNIVVITVYLAYARIRSEGDLQVGAVSGAETLLLGLGTTAGVVAMTIVLLPGLRGLGWRFRFRFQPGHPAVRKGARLGIWALSYAGGYQAGLIVVLILANRVAGGVAAYQWAYTFFYLPHALFGVPIFHVLFTAMSEHVARREVGQVGRRLSDGLSMLWFVLLPVSAALLLLAHPLARLTLEYGAMTPEGSVLVARTLAAFALGLPAYSTFLVLTRAFYALSDTRTPALVNLAMVVVSGGVGAILFLTAPDDWSVPGLALGHSLGAGLGALVLVRLLGGRVSDLGDWGASATRSVLGVAPAALVMWLSTLTFAGSGRVDSLLELTVAGLAGAGTYVGVMAWIGSRELDRLKDTAKSLFRGRR